MNTTALANRYSTSNNPSTIVHPMADHPEGHPPVPSGALDMQWPEVEEPGGLAVQQGEPGEPGQVDQVVVLHPQPPQAAAHVVNIAGQVNPAFAAAVVAIQGELDQPPLAVAPLQVLAPQAPPRRSLCDAESLMGCGVITLALGAVTSAIVGGVLAFTSEDPDTQHDGIIAFAMGLGTIAGWCCTSVCCSD